MTDFLRAIASPTMIWVLIPIAAIVGSFVYKGMKLHYEHKEKMARIENGQEP